MSHRELFWEAVQHPREANTRIVCDERRRYYRLTEFGLRVAQAEARRFAQLVSVAQSKRLLPGPGTRRRYLMSTTPAQQTVVRTESF